MASEEDDIPTDAACVAAGAATVELPGIRPDELGAGPSAATSSAAGSEMAQYYCGRCGALGSATGPGGCDHDWHLRPLPREDATKSEEKSTEIERGDKKPKEELKIPLVPSSTNVERERRRKTGCLYSAHSTHPKLKAAEVCCKKCPDGHGRKCEKQKTPMTPQGSAEEQMTHSARMARLQKMNEETRAMTPLAGVSSDSGGG